MDETLNQKKPARRQAILDAAARVFAARGYEHSSIRDIGQEAGVADGTIYNYFRDKKALVEALVERLVTDLGREEARPLGTGTPEGLESRIEERMGRLHGAYGTLAAVLPVILGSEELREAFRKRFLDPVLEGLADDLGGGAPALPSRVLLSAALGFQILLLLGDGPTRAAWAAPGDLARVWVPFVRLAADLSREGRLDEGDRLG